MILITGATGQVGREALKALVAAGTAVRALVRNPSSSMMGLHGVQVVQGDFGDDASLAGALDGIDAMLLAGRDSPAHSLTAPTRSRACPTRQCATYRQVVRNRSIAW